jgi:hypothetical protein
VAITDISEEEVQNLDEFAWALHQAFPNKDLAQSDEITQKNLTKIHVALDKIKDSTPTLNLLNKFIVEGLDEYLLEVGKHPIRSVIFNIVFDSWNEGGDAIMNKQLYEWFTQYQKINAHDKIMSQAAFNQQVHYLAEKGLVFFEKIHTDKTRELKIYPTLMGLLFKKLSARHQ